ncbi:hypothetical protein BN844_1243 [Pseudomonas sp. SHC52]|nr:hypothetical protein BN844_1243 [Pseudomonas sp. SHC52]
MHRDFAQWVVVARIVLSHVAVLAQKGRCRKRAAVVPNE